MDMTITDEMADNTLAALTARLAALKAQTEAVEAQLKEHASSERNSAILEVRILVGEYGITADEVFTPSKSKPATRRKTKAENTPAEAIEYAEPGGKRWTSGKPGKPPKWVQDAKAAGTLDSMRVQ